jgi:glucan phosphoethanolaminetransferase (alkaline phosphatase superfamily)
MKIGDNNNLKSYHWIIPILTTPIFLFFSAKYFWMFYSTMFDKSGLWSSMYSYYDLTKTQYGFYNLILTLILCGLVFTQLTFLIKKNTYRLNKTFLIMGISIGLIILSEIYLNTRFVGKG